MDLLLDKIALFANKGAIIPFDCLAHKAKVRIQNGTGYKTERQSVITAHLINED
jgi:hypothetical protein